VEELQEQIQEHNVEKLTTNMEVMRPTHWQMMLTKMSSGTKHLKLQILEVVNINLETVEERDLRDPLSEV
jgi:hypothetical protein